MWSEMLLASSWNWNKRKIQPCNEENGEGKYGPCSLNDGEERLDDSAYPCTCTCTAHSLFKSSRMTVKHLQETVFKIVDSYESRLDSLILVAIILNSISMACTDYAHVDNNYEPTTDGSYMNAFVEKAEIVFVFIFLVESVLKIIAYGFICAKTSYLQRDGWNILDFIAVVAR